MRTELTAGGDPAGLPLGGVIVAHPLRGRIRRAPVPKSAATDTAASARVMFALHADEALMAAGRLGPADLAALRRGARGLLRSRGWTIAAAAGREGPPFEARISIRPMPDPLPSFQVLVGLQAIVTPEAAVAARMRQLRDYTIVRLDGVAAGRSGSASTRATIDAVVGRWLSRVF